MTAIATAPGTVSGSATQLGVTTTDHDWVRPWLRLEGLAAFAAALTLFGINCGDWIVFVALIFVPDLSAVGYLAGPRVGAFSYNLLHSWTLGFAVLLIGLWLSSPLAILAAAILIAHVGIDRALGYGLKLPSGFRDTHLGRIGRDPA